MPIVSSAALIAAESLEIPDDRCPSLRETKRHVEKWGFDQFPTLLRGFKHNGAGPKLNKQKKAKSAE
jgi:hypothetical protein